VARAQPPDRGREVGRAPVAEVVVGHDALDAAHPRPGEEGGRAGPEAGAGRPALVGVNLRVGQAAVVVDGRVDTVVAQAPEGSGPQPAPVGPPAPALGDAPELLDVDVHHERGAGTDPALHTV
jgi:hypothetical protein